MLEYFTVQYVQDPVRGEGKNVAVIGTAVGQGYVRAVGLGTDGKVDMAEFRAFTGLSVPETAAFPDWIDYFRCVAEHDAASRESLARELTTLANTAGPFVLGNAGETEIIEPESPERAMDRVFDRMVGHVPPDRVDRFPEQLEHFLHHSELRTLPDFHQDPEIELGLTDEAVKLRFHLALVNAPAVGFRIVRCQGDEQHIARALRAALTEFKRAADVGFLDPERSVVLTDRAWPAGRLADQLARTRVTVIDVFAEEAPRQLHELLQRRLQRG